MLLKIGHKEKKGTMEEEAEVKKLRNVLNFSCFYCHWFCGFLSLLLNDTATTFTMSILYYYMCSCL